MGQAQSRPEPKNSSGCDATPDAAGPKKKRANEIMKVPANWKNDADFYQISPISDISNPSQFRGRLHQKNNNNHNNNAALVGSAVRANANRRTSKVCPKQPPPKAGAVPAPANFYFPESHKEDSVSATSSEQQQQQQPKQQQPKQQIEQQPEQKQSQQQPQPRGTRPWMATWKAKCSKAKQQMGECFQARKEMDLEHPSHPENHHHHQQQVVPDDKNNTAKQSNKAYLQFDPVWKEEDGILSPRRTTKKQPNYVQRLSGTESGSHPSSKDESEKEKEQHVMNHGFTAKGPTALGSTVMERIQSLQQASGASITAGSFQPNRLSVGTTKSSSSGGSSGGQRHPESNPMQHRLSVGTSKSSSSSSSSSSIGQRHPESNHMQRGRDPRPVQESSRNHHQHRATERKQARSSSESNPRNSSSRPESNPMQRGRDPRPGQESSHNDHHQQHRATERKQARSSSESNPRNSSSRSNSIKGSQKEAAIRDGSAPIFRTASAESLHGGATKRASIGRSFSNGSRNNQQDEDEDDERRTSIQEQVQRQIDAQKSSGRVQRLRQQYQQQMHLEKQNANKHRRRTQSVPGRVSADHSIPVRKHEHDKEAEQKKQQQQQAKKKKSLSSNTTAGRTSRSASVPRARPSIDGSALLHLTGWTDNKCFPKKEQPIPALLKVAGWKPPPPAKKAGVVRPEKAPTVEREQKEKSRRPARVSDPAKESAKEYQHQSVQRTQSDGGCIPLKSALRKTAPTDMKRTEEALKYSNEELDGDSPQPKLSLAKPIGKPLAYMLQQAYFLGDDDGFRQSTIYSPFMNKYDDACGQSPSNDSHMSSGSASSGPLVSNQALYNGDFLFTNNPNVLVAPQPSNESAGHSISTLNSRNRVSAFSGQPVTIRRTSSNDNSSLTSSSTGDYRRVRFSDELVVDRSDENLIARQLSDLTDMTGATSTNMTRTSMLSIPRIDSIPEDDAEDAISKSPAPPSIMDSNSVSEDGPVAVFEDTDEDDDGDEEEDNQASSPTSPVMRWSYHTENGLTKGVTPMINGKSTSNGHHATKSPYLRFKEAKGKFTSTKAHKESPAKKRVSPAKKRSSPAKRGSLVSSRIAAMEGRRARSETGTTTKIIMPRKVRRPTTGDQVLAPRKGSLVSPLFKHQSFNTVNKKQEESWKPAASETDAQSPTLIDGQVIGSPPAAHRENGDASTVVSLEEEADDAFGDIRHPTTIDEDDSRTSTSSDESESDDDFDNLLQNTRGMSVHDEGSSYQQSSIGSTILRGPRFSMSSSTSPHSTGTETRSLTSTVVVQRRPSPVSVFSSGSSLGDSASMPSALRSRDVNVIPSAVGRMVQNQKQQFPFRETAKVVKPNEQTHRAVTGSHTISQMQRTPMEARTWRALAAAAQDKKRNNNHLSERNRHVPTSVSKGF